MSTEVESMLTEIGSILKATETNITTMLVGERIQMQDLATAVGLAVAKEPKHVLNFVNYFVHNTNLAYVSRGKNGGIIRGAKTSKAIKADESSNSVE